MTPETRIESPMAGSARGFSLIEMLVAVAIMGIIAAIATPSIVSWRSNLNASQSAKNVVDTLREARSKAMTTNYQHKVQFNVQQGQYQVLKMSQSYDNVANPSAVSTTVQGWVQLPTGATMRSGACTSTSTNWVNVLFNADGTARLETPAGLVPPANNVTVCIQGGASTKMYQIMVASPSGRISIN